MEVLNDSSSHKQYSFEYIEPGSEFNGLDSFWDPALVRMLEPQVCTFLPVAAKSCSSTREALSRTGSPNESLSSNEGVLMQDLLCHSNLKSMSTARVLSCHPHIRKCSKRAWTPSTQNAVRKELECLLGESSLDERVYAVGTPSVMNYSLKVDSSQMYTGSRVFGGIHVKNEDSALIESHEKDKLFSLDGESSSKQSFEDDGLAYAYTKSPVEACTSISLESSENSTSDNLLGSSEILQPVAYDQSTMLEYAAAPGLEAWFEDPFALMSVLQTYTNDGNFINYQKKEESMVNDGGEHPPYSYNRPTAPHAQGFLAHAVCQQGNDSMPIALNESIEAPGHLRIDFEDNYTRPHNLAQEGRAASGCAQFGLPKPILGPLHTNNPLQSLHTLHDGFNACLATFTGVPESKLLGGKYTDSRQLSNVYEDTSVKSCCSYGSEGSVAQQNQISVKKEDGSLDVVKTREWGSNAMNVCSQFDLRVKKNHPETGVIHLLAAGAEAVAGRKSDSASVILGRLKDMVSSLGNTMQRVVAYFIQSLEHQAEGGKRVDHMKIKSQGDILAAFQILHEIFPYIKFGHFTANQAILEAVQGAKRVHIVDFEIMEGIQWPAFMQALISRQGGPSELHITALCRPHWEHGLAMVRKTGKRLSEFASALGLSFRFSLLKTEHDERFNPKQLKLFDGDALVVNCMVHLPHMPRRSMASVASFLQGMRQLSPTTITVVEEELGCNTTGVASYLSEALYHFHAMCDSLEACLPSEVEARLLVERVFIAPRIDSAMAMWSQTMPSSSTHRIELSNKYKWSTVMHAAGFKPRPLSYHSHSQAKLLLGLHRDGFYLEEWSHYLVLGWQSKPLFAASVWN